MLLSREEGAVEAGKAKLIADDAYALGKQLIVVLENCGQAQIGDQLSGVVPDQCINDLDTATKFALDFLKHDFDGFFIAKNIGSFIKVLENLTNSCPLVNVNENINLPVIGDFNTTTCVHAVESFLMVVSKYETAYESRLHKEMIDLAFQLATQANGILGGCGQEDLS